MLNLKWNLTWYITCIITKIRRKKKHAFFRKPWEDFFFQIIEYILHAYIFIQKQISKHSTVQFFPSSHFFKSIIYEYGQILQE